MSWLSITDYKIQSRKIITGILSVSTCTSGAMVFVDYMIDLKAASFEAFLCFFLANLFILLLSIIYPKAKWIDGCIPALIFVFFEYIFFHNPTVLNVIIYWFPFVPILAVMTQGLRSSQLWTGIIVLAQIGNFLYAKTALGSNSYQLEISIDSFFYSGIIFLIATLATVYLLYNLMGHAYNRAQEQNEELSDLKNDIERKSKRLAAFNAALIELTRNPTTVKSIETLYFNVCSLTQESLAVNRVSIWLFDKTRENLILQLLLQDGEDRTEEVTITKKDFPAYFVALEEKPCIAASDARNHEDTSVFTENYLKPLGILSMLDCPILLDQKAIGVVCCEHIDSKRKWEAEDALITQSLADFIAVHFKNEQIKSLLSTLKTQNKELSLNGSMIESMNKELHQLNQKLLESNDSLEAAVNERTKELVIQNNQLKEYSFVNSHMLRAPLSSILGISNLLLAQNTSITDRELLTALQQSTKNLDEVVRRISTTLEDGSNLSRKDIDYIINEQFKNHDVE